MELSVPEVFLFGMWVGCAFRQADDERKVRMREEVQPMLESFRVSGDPEPIRAKVREIMGQDWTPALS